MGGGFAVQQLAIETAGPRQTTLANAWQKTLAEYMYELWRCLIAHHAAADLPSRLRTLRALWQQGVLTEEPYRGLVRTGFAAHQRAAAPDG